MRESRWSALADRWIPFLAASVAWAALASQAAGGGAARIPNADDATAAAGLDAAGAETTVLTSERPGAAAPDLGVRGTGCAVSCQSPTLTNAELSDIANAVNCADDFRAQGSTLSGICFWGVYLNNVPPTSEAFEIKIFADAGGVPGALVFVRSVFQFNGSVTAPIPTGRVLGGIVNEYEYHVTLSPAATLTPGACYWLQIRNLAVTAPNGWGWMYSTGGGDGRYMIDATPGDPYHNYNESHGFIPDPASPDGFPLDVDSDLAWCIDTPIGAAGSCGPAVVDAPCPLPDTPNCQPVDTNDNTARLLVSDGVTQTIADDFTPGQSGSVIDLCFTGVYNNFNPVGDSFRITFYADAGGRPGAILRRFNPGDLAIQRGWTGTKVLRLVPYFEYHASIDLGQVVLTAGECYWLEIVNLTSQDTWLWPSALGGNGNALRDGGGSGQPLDGYNPADSEPHDMAFCITQPISDFSGCTPDFPIPPNDTCTSAQTLSVGAAPVSGTTLGALDDTGPPPCGNNLVDGPGVWYTLLGTGATLTASLCYPGTDYDAALAVYCGSCGNLTCVRGANDDAACAQSPNTAAVSWASAPGARYYIRVSGDLGVVGNLQIAVTTDSTPAVPDACTPCEVDTADPSVTYVEFEPCGSASGGNGTCAGAEPISIGDTVLGTAFADAGIADIDTYLFTVSQADYFDISVRAEFPVLLQVDQILTGCGDLETLFGGAFITQPCQQGRLGAAYLAPGNYLLRVQPNGFHGLPCGAHNNYLLTLDLTPVGACCLADGSCTQLPESECLTGAGVYAGDGTDCATTTCEPVGACCLPDGSCVNATASACRDQSGAYQGDGTDCASVACQTLGACCMPDGSCSAMSSADCAAAGGDYRGDGTDCASANCPVPLGACCLADGSCADLPPSLCSAQSGTYLGDGTTCATDSCTPACPCETDGDAAQVDVFDLLAYLSLWFDHDAAAEFTSDSPPSIDVFDLLAYLACWFDASSGAGCP